MLTSRRHTSSFANLALCAVATFMLLATKPALSQSLTFTADSLDGFWLTDQAWRFKAGDAMEWADPALDDSEWTTTESTFPPVPDASGEEWNGIGWLRLTFRTDSTVTEDIVLTIGQSGASEVYVNGRLAAEIGAVSPDSEMYDYVLIERFRVFVPLEADSVYTLAVRYANYDLPKWLAIQQGDRPGLLRMVMRLGVDITVNSYDEWVRRNRSVELLDRLVGIFAGVLIGLSLLGFLIFLVRRVDRAIFYLSAHIASLAMLIVFAAGPLRDGGSFMASSILWLLAPFLQALSVGFIVVGVAHAFFPTRRFVHLWVWTFIGVGMVFFYSPYEISRVVPMAFAGILLIDALQMMVRAVWKRIPGARILGLGIVSLVAMLVLSQGSLVVAMFGFLSFPVSVVALIAHRYNLTNRELGKQLELSERLSEEKLSAEREKQQLIQEQNVMLNERVEERTEELRSTLDNLKATQAQLVEQEKLASLGSLTAGIAHEIKNPLNFVNNFAEISTELVEELSEAVAAGRAEEAQSILKEISDNAMQIAKHGRRADSIVKSMMQHARGGSSVPESVDLNAFLGEYIDLAWHGRRAREPEFQTEVIRAFDETVGDVHVQPQEMGRVILNLLNNAFDALKGTDPATVTVTSKRTNGSVEIMVEDNGPGIPADVRERIFEPFFTTKPTGEGTGLGLSLSYDIVTKGHGGEMTVGESADGGAAFLVRLSA